jgi:AcrR family transcriptional regulator
MPRGVGLNAERILDAAQLHADAHGLGALSLTVLAEAFGVRKPSLYKHVDGLPAVLDGLALRGCAELAARLDAVPAGEPVAEAVAFARAWRAMAATHPGLYASLTRAHVHQPPAVREAQLALLSAVLERVRAWGLSEDPVHVARAIRAVVHGFVSLEAAQGFGLGQDVGDSMEAAVAAMMTGFVARRGGPAAPRA